MHKSGKWAKLSWKDPVWDLIRYYRALRGSKLKNQFIENLVNASSLWVDESAIPIQPSITKLFLEYLDVESELLYEAMGLLRTEKEALEFCKSQKFRVGKTRTKSKDHHQSSKAMIATVSGFANSICFELGSTCDPDPQNRCIWAKDNQLHVTARNLDGAIPSLTNPKIIWEIKEYWGQTKGGSKMSDALYECHLVGREIREYEEKSGSKITHIVFLDGKEQWMHRKSDIRRFIDITYQGIIDYLILGKEVETEWPNLLRTLL